MAAQFQPLLIRNRKVRKRVIMMDATRVVVIDELVPPL